MDGATGFFAKTGVGLCMVKVKVVMSEVVELIFGETQFPGNVVPADGEGVVVFDDEGHGMMVK